jgi:hypothetical protein
MAATALKDLAKVIRSKNSGPFELTFDVIFDKPAVYQRVKESRALDAAKLAALYKIDLEDVIVCMFFEPALAFKLTVKRKWPQGSVAERDTFGAQQHVPLFGILIE